MSADKLIALGHIINVGVSSGEDGSGLYGTFTQNYYRINFATRTSILSDGTGYQTIYFYDMIPKGKRILIRGYTFYPPQK